jgi:hypothetical protein
MRAKSKTNKNAKGKPSALGKVGNIKVGDRFQNKEDGLIYVINAIDPNSNLPFTAVVYGLFGWIGANAPSHTFLTRKCKKI